ncbi:MAG: homoserine kinase [Planctomycetota bacterium]|nr:homoserine kinase [Planctomycetota bacterium]
MSSPATVVAQAPATVANVAVGFDVLGFAFGSAFDRVAVTRVDPGRAEGPVTIDMEGSSVGGAVAAGEGRVDLPSDPARNTASAALLAMAAELGPEFAFRVAVHKAIPLSAGMGGSAASAVAAVVAANGLLDSPLPREQLFDYALAGEAAASGARHADNVAPCLFGGLCACLPTGGAIPRVVPIPVPASLHCVVVRPHVEVSTRSARAVLAGEVELEAFTAQSAHLAAFVAACYEGDLGLMRVAMQDLVIGPQRESAIPGFEDVHAAALANGAIGCAIAGSGPSVFAWAASADEAATIRDAMLAALAQHGIGADAFLGPIATEGAKVVPGAGQV